MAILLGFYLGHDSSIALSVDGIVKYRKSERRFGVKHHRADFGFVIDTLGDWGFSLRDVDFCAYTDGNRNNLGLCGADELFCEGRLEGVKSFCIDHHYAHILSGWPVVDTESLQFGLCVDGRGDHEKSTTLIKNPSSNPKVIYEESGLKMGWEFYQIGRLLGFKGLEYDFAGKLMGLQSYCDAELKKFGLKSIVDLDTSNLLSNREGGHYKSFSEWHEYWFVRTKKIFESFFQKEDFIQYSGGCAQNTVYNYKLLRLFPNIFIPPHCYDGGLSLGCLEFMRLYLGHEKFSKKGFPYWQDDQIKEPRDATVKKAARMLADGKIIGWAQGRGELGPRALGNRSILMNAIGAENKDTLNRKIKKREPWRPYAGSVLSSRSSDYFGLKESKYMLYACEVLNYKIPAITHVDGSCRMQTVSECDNPVFYALLNEYFNLTGIPVLLNTSLNIMGNPIASLESQIVDLARSNLDAVFAGDKVYRNKIF